MKKKLMMALSLVLVAAMSIGGTVAWLTATTGPVTNIFTVGNISMEMDEAKTDEYGVKLTGDAAKRVDGNTYKLIPGHPYSKDPTVYIQPGSEKCYVFIHVANGIDEIEAQGTTDIEAQIVANGWNAVNDNGYYWKVQDAVPATPAGQEPVPASLKVFDSFKIADTAQVTNYATAKIVINACAVQFDGMADEDAAFAACPEAFLALED